MDTGPLAAILVFVSDWLLRIALATRVIMRRRSVGVSLSWLSIILIVPFIGAGIYLLFGENRLGNKRAVRAIEIHDRYRYWQRDLRERSSVDWAVHAPAARALARQADTAVGIPSLDGNRLELISAPGDVFGALVDDIREADRRCHLEFYIWSGGGAADEVVEALIDAAQRGVHCRVLVDSVGSKAFLAGSEPRRLRAAGVELVGALPVNVFRALFRRMDLRNHRKIAVIDGRVAYTGSQNLADPRFFRKDAGVGEWIDAMVRVEGPAVEALEGIFLKDWELETGRGFGILEETAEEHPPSIEDGATVQVVPSGPGFRNDAIHHLLLTTIYSAQHELVMTTPYFVPDDSMMDALVSAGHRDVDVTLIVPARVDSMLVRLASRSHFSDLLDANVRIMRCHEGLLHTKSVTVDGALTLIGSVNLDMRSFWLNFEVTMFVYDRRFTGQVRALQERYMDGSDAVEREAWRNRPVRKRLAENTVRLASPLL